MQWLLRPKTLFIMAALVLMVPFVYWLWVFYRTAEALMTLTLEHETVLETLNTALSLMFNSFRDAPVAYFIPVLAAVALLVLGLRRR